MTHFLRGPAEYSGTFVGICLVLALGTYHGITTADVSVDLPWLTVHVATTSAVPTVVAFSVLAALSGLLLAREVFRPRDAIETVEDGPRLTAIVPVYRDADVLERSVDSLLASNYGALEVAIVGEPGDERTLAVARELANHPDVRCFVNRQAGSKAGAINDAVARLDADYFASFDADERVDPDFVPAAVHQLVEADRDVFQARRVPRATGPVETLAYCERLLFNASYKLIEPLGFTYCRSSSVAFTREAHAAVGGFDELVTEDIDFAHKCFRHDLDVRQARNLTNEMEAPHTLRDLWCQRKRWRLGHIEVLHKALGGNFERNGVRGMLSTARLATELLASVLMVALIGKLAVVVYLGAPELLALPLIAIAAAVVPVLYRDYRAGHVRTLSPTLLLVPLIYPGFGVVTIRCALEYLVSWNGEWYRVTKTGS